jgi:hypothetical protein
VTSKRPVSRHRPAIELPKDTSRDPRFAPLSGTLDNRHFATQYAFLPELRAAEHAELRSSLKLARTRLASSPRDQRDARAAEVRRLEAALVRAESAVNRDRRERVEREALEAAKKAEHAKQKEGKGAWHMPNGRPAHCSVLVRQLKCVRSGEKGATCQGPLRGACCDRRAWCRAQGDRAQAEEDRAEGEALASVRGALDCGRRRGRGRPEAAGSSAGRPPAEEAALLVDMRRERTYDYPCRKSGHFVIRLDHNVAYAKVESADPGRCYLGICTQCGVCQHLAIFFYLPELNPCIQSVDASICGTMRLWI